jgi:serine protease Do
MSEGVGGILRQFSNESAALAERIVGSTAIVRGQTRSFDVAAGSAWLYDDEHLVTNDHVVADLVDPIEGQFPGHTPLHALLIGRDPLTDLAVLRVDPQDIAPLGVCPTGARPGELCFAFGSPGRFPREHQRRHRQRTQTQSAGR